MHLHFKTLQSKLFTSYSFVIIGSLMVILATFVIAFTRNISQNTEITQINLCSSIVNSMNTEIEKMNTISMNVVYSNLIKNKFKEYLTLGGSAHQELTAAQKWEALRMIFDMVTAIVGPFQTVSQVNLYSLDGASVGTGILSMQKNLSLSDKSWYIPAMKGDGNKFIGIPEKADYAQMLTSYVSDHQFISLCRVYHDQVYQPEGIVEIMQDCEELFDFVDLTKEKNPNTNIYILNKLGEQVYPYIITEQDRGLFYFNRIRENHLKPLRNHAVKSDQKDKEIMTYEIATIPEWTVIIVASAKTLRAPIYSYTLIFIIFSLIIVLIIIRISYLIAKNVSVPLKGLSRSFAQFSLEDLLLEVQSPHFQSGEVEEIETLNRAFLTMRELVKSSSAELLTARTEETKAKMLALQSLMNPHFLYNSLANISVMAEENMTEEIISLCRNVSCILRYISTEDSRGVHLGMELDYTIKYLECMKIRYGDNLSYQVHVPDEMCMIFIPKLIIQPLVENSIMHGFHMQPPWLIEIAGSYNEDTWEIIVKDNGIGFEPDYIQRLNQKMSDIKTSKDLSTMTIGGMGLSNVYLRLYLLYGDSAKLSIDNLPAGGCYIKIQGQILICEEDENE